MPARLVALFVGGLSCLACSTVAAFTHVVNPQGLLSSTSSVAGSLSTDPRVRSVPLWASSSELTTVKPNGSTETVPFAVFRKDAPFPAARAALTKAGMIAFIVGMCITLPLTLIPQWIAYRLGFLTRIQKERYAVLTSEFCARWVLRLFPFMRLTTFPYHDPNPPPSIWVCNHSR